MVTSDLSLSKDITCSLECKMRGQKSGFGVDFNSSQHQMCISNIFFICIAHQTIQFFQFKKSADILKSVLLFYLKLGQR